MNELSIDRIQVFKSLALQFVSVFSCLFWVARSWRCGGGGWRGWIRFLVFHWFDFWGFCGMACGFGSRRRWGMVRSCSWFVGFGASDLDHGFIVLVRVAEALGFGLCGLLRFG